MATDSVAVAETGEDRPAADRSTNDSECHPVCGPHRLPVATTTERLSQMEIGLQCLLALAEAWHLGADPRRLAAASSPGGRQEADAQRGCHRQSVGAYRRGRRRTG